MMKFKTHYERTAKARDLVGSYLSLNKSAEFKDIQNVLLNATGLGARWLNCHLENMESNGLINICGSTITVLDVKKKGGD